MTLLLNLLMSRITSDNGVELWTANSVALPGTLASCSLPLNVPPISCHKARNTAYRYWGGGNKQTYCSHSPQRIGNAPCSSSVASFICIEIPSSQLPQSFGSVSALSVKLASVLTGAAVIRLSSVMPAKVGSVMTFMLSPSGIKRRRTALKLSSKASGAMLYGRIG